ncbi:MAG: hypothetical protein AAFP68_02375 [Pseudomonadota bacterium]
MAIGRGILAVMNDCAPGAQDAYERWYLSEHLAERVSIEGFRWGRRYRALDAAASPLPEYLTYYETDDPSVLSSKTYLGRVNDPTPQTRWIMTEVFLNMSRTVCRRTQCKGAVRSAWVVVATSDRPIEFPTISMPQLSTFWRESWINAENEDAAASTEEGLRGGDKKIAAALLQDCATADDACQIAADLNAQDAVNAGAYRLTGTLDRSDLLTDV